MRIILRTIIAFLSLMLACVLFSNCKEYRDKKGEPIMTYETPIFDEATQTFSITVKADSVEGATVTFFIMIGDSILVKNDNGKFIGISPFDEGYDVKLRVQWPDTIIERIDHIMDFVVPTAPIEKISTEDFTKLINAKDESLRIGTNEHVAQGVRIHVVDSKMQIQMLPDAIVLIENGVWKGAEILKLEYNEKNIITDITMRPIEEKVDVIDMDDEDYDY